MNAHSLLQHRWNLDPEIDFLNHGSFGACPLDVLEVQRAFQNALEREPIRFLAPERDLEAKLDRVRSEVANLVSADPQDLAWVRNATEGVNAVLRSIRFNSGDEIIITDHGYNACNNAARFAMERTGGSVKTVSVPFPLTDSEEIVDVIVNAFSPRTRLIMIDHVTSPTGIIFPVERIVAAARSRDIRVLIDGAHAPGMIRLDLAAIDADYYTSNHHKWLCGPKASGFLFVRRELQSEIRPLAISHAANRPRPGRSRFLAEFDWQGTFDPSPLLAVPAAIDFLATHRDLGLLEHMQQNHQLAVQARQLISDAIGASLPAPASMIGSTATIPLPNAPSPTNGQIDPLQKRLFDHYRIEVPIFHWPDASTRWLRISSQSYNQLEQYQRLAEALVSEHVVFHY